MIIPFDMTYYLSDADHELARYNDKSLRDIQQSLRYGLDGHVAASVVDMYNAHRILLDTLPEANPDLMQMYWSVRYRYAEPIGARPVELDRTSTEKPGAGLKRWIREKTGAEQQAIHQDQPDPSFSEGMLRGPQMGQRFLHAELTNPDILQYFYQRYGTDLFLFVNQMEIKTLYEHCLDRASGNFMRDVSVHYSIYDLQGKLLAGNVVTVVVASNTRDLYQVMSRAFPALSAAVVSGLPNPMTHQPAR